MRLIPAAALALALASLPVFAQNATSGLSTTPGMSGESGGTVTGAGSGRDGAFGSPNDTRDGAARGSTNRDAKGTTSDKGSAGAGRGAGTGSDKRGSGASGADPR